MGNYFLSSLLIMFFRADLTALVYADVHREWETHLSPENRLPLMFNGLPLCRVRTSSFEDGTEEQLPYYYGSRSASDSLFI